MCRSVSRDGGSTLVNVYQISRRHVPENSCFYYLLFVNFSPTDEGCLSPMATFVRITWPIWMLIHWIWLGCSFLSSLYTGLVPSLLCLRHWNMLRRQETHEKWLGVICRPGVVEKSTELFETRHNKCRLNLRVQELSSTMWIYSARYNLFILIFRTGISQSMGDGLWAGRPGFESRQGQEIFSSPQSPDRLWGPPSFLSNVYRELSPPW
jgi:hypothetical protein